MAQTVLITLTLAGADTGPFDLYSNVDGYTSPFENNVAKIDLEAGYLSTLVPDVATTIRVQSDNPLCGNFVDLVIGTTTTTSTTETPATTTTTTTAVEEFSVFVYGKLEDTLSAGDVQIQSSLTNNGVDWASVGPPMSDTSCIQRGIVTSIPSGSTLYIRVVSGVNPVEFGFNGVSDVCPSSDVLCLESIVVTATQDISLTVRVVANNVVTC